MKIIDLENLQLYDAEIKEYLEQKMSGGIGEKKTITMPKFEVRGNVLVCTSSDVGSIDVLVPKA
jgi:hypothetical protein